MDIQGMIVARDSFIKFLQANVSGITIKPYTEPQQKLLRNALNVRFLDDVATIGAQVWDSTVSLDILSDNTVDSTQTAERKAIIWQNTVLSALTPGRVGMLYIDGAWAAVGYVAWTTLTGLRFKDVPAEAYIHKNLTLRMTYSIKT